MKSISIHHGRSAGIGGQDAGKGGLGGGDGPQGLEQLASASLDRTWDGRGVNLFKTFSFV